MFIYLDIIKFALILHSLNYKYKERRLESAPKILPILEKSHYQYRYVVGNYTGYDIYDDGLFLHIPLEETYENIPQKMIIAFKWCLEKFNPDYILKCDDDTIICYELTFIEEESSIFSFDYITSYSTEYWSTPIDYHINLVSSDKYKKILTYSPILYGAGPMYYLSNKALNDLEVDDSYMTIFEDMNMGYSWKKYSWSSSCTKWKERGIINWAA